MEYRRCGNSRIKLPCLSLGLWHNFGLVDNFINRTNIIKFGFGSGICHFDLANNYGPPAGSAGTNFGKILNKNFKSYRDEMIISSKAGYTMWPRQYGDWDQKSI